MKLSQGEIDALVHEYELCRDTNMSKAETVNYLYMLGYHRGRRRNTLAVTLSLLAGAIAGFLLAGNL